MPLKVMDLVELRLRVLADVRAGVSVREAAARHGTSKSQVYEWRARYDAEGAGGLLPRSRRPVSSPRRLAAEVEDAVVRWRVERPRWGAKKIRAKVGEELGWAPAVSTVHQVLVRRGLVAGRGRPGGPGQGWQRFVRPSPNDLWHIDATRHLLRSRRPFWVIDLVDDHSRYLLRTHVCAAPTGRDGWEAVRATVASCGLPRQLLSDNGLNFTGRLHGVVVAFERQVRAAGIDLIHAAPYHPQTLGKLERQHATQNDWITDHGPPASLPAARELLDAYRHDYNTVRPHEAIGQQVPARRYRPDPGVDLPAIDLHPADPFPAGCVMRVVSPDGTFKYSYREHKIDPRWAGVSIGLIHDDDHLHVFYGSSRIKTLPVPGLKPVRGYNARGTLTP